MQECLESDAKDAGILERSGADCEERARRIACLLLYSLCYVLEVIARNETGSEGQGVHVGRWYGMAIAGQRGPELGINESKWGFGVFIEQCCR